MAEDLLAEFRTYARQSGPRCGLEKPALKADEIKALRAAYVDTTITNKAIVAWLAARGIKVSVYQTTRHRNGDCRCKEVTR